MSIDTGKLVLWMPAGDANQQMPQPGGKVRLELSLPVAEQNAGAKYLAVQARVADTVELNDGSRQVTFTFRKASFKDRVESESAKPSKPNGKVWRM